MRRVVVTGLGMVSPLASGVDESWKRLLAGESGADTISLFDASHLATTYACEVPRGDGTAGTFNADDWMEPKDQRKVDPFIIFAVAAADMALADAGWAPESDEDQFRSGVLIGSGIGGSYLDCRDGGADQGKGSAAGVAVLYSVVANKSGVGTGQHQARAQGAEPCGGDGLFNGRACDR